MGNDLIEGADAQTTFLHNFKVCKIFKFFFSKSSGGSWDKSAQDSVVGYQER